MAVRQAAVVTGSMRVQRWIPRLIAAIAVLVYMPTLDAGFVYDDHQAIEAHPGVRAPSWHLTLATPFWGPAETARMTMWRPLVTATFAANAAMRTAGAPGLDPLPFHATNLLIFAGLVLLVWHVSTLLGLSLAGQLTATLLFALHPLNTEPVASLVGRADLLCALAGLGYVAAMVRQSLIGMTLCLTLALLAKETALVLPGVALAWWAAQRLQHPETGPSLRVSVVLVHVAILTAWLVARVAIAGSVTPEAQGVVENPMVDLGVTGRLFGALTVAGLLLERLVTGGPLNTDYGLGFFPQPGLHVAGGLGLLAWVALIVGLVLAVRRSPRVAVALALITGPLVLLGHVLIPATTAFADRLWPLPIAGLCLGLGMLAGRAVASGIRARVGLGVVLSALALSSALAVHARLPDWTTDERVFEAMVRTATGAYRANVNGAAMALQRGEVDLSRRRLQTALALHPEGPAAWLSLARVESAAGQATAAWRALAEARTRGGATDKWHAVACLLHVRFGTPGDAVQTCRAAIDLARRSRPTPAPEQAMSDPEQPMSDPELAMWLAMACERSGDEACALDAMAQAERLQEAAPSVSPQVLSNAAVFHARRGDNLRALLLLSRMAPEQAARPELRKMQQVLCQRVAMQAAQDPSDVRLRAWARRCKNGDAAR